MVLRRCSPVQAHGLGQIALSALAVLAQDAVIVLRVAFALDGSEVEVACSSYHILRYADARRVDVAKARLRLYVTLIGRLRPKPYRLCLGTILKAGQTQVKQRVLLPLFGGLPPDPQRLCRVFRDASTLMWQKPSLSCAPA